MRKKNIENWVFFAKLVLFSLVSGSYAAELIDVANRIEIEPFYAFIWTYSGFIIPPNLFNLLLRWWKYGNLTSIIVWQNGRY